MHWGLEELRASCRELAEAKETAGSHQELPDRDSLLHGVESLERDRAAHTRSWTLLIGLIQRGEARHIAGICRLVLEVGLLGFARSRQVSIHRTRIAENKAPQEPDGSNKNVGPAWIAKPARLAPPRHPRTGARLPCSTTGCFGFSHPWVAGLVVELNRAVAIAMCEGLEQGLRLIDDLLTRDQLAREHLSGYPLAHSARADLCRRLGRIPEARASYEKALALLVPGNDRQEPERRFLARRIEELK